MTADERHWLLRKLHSLSGVLPIGVFLLEHFFSNSYAIYGKQAFNDQVARLQGLPYVPLIEILFIGLPILFHAAYGLWITKDANLVTSGRARARDWSYKLQRVSGVLLVVFIALHFWHFRLRHALFGTPIDFDEVAARLAEPLWLVFYGVGVVAAVFHFANGLWNFALSWGLATSPRSQRLAAWVAGGVGLVLLAVAVNFTLAFLGVGHVVLGPGPVTHAAGP